MSAKNGLFFGISAPRRSAQYTDKEKNAVLKAFRTYGALDANQLGAYARLDDDAALAVLNDLLRNGEAIIFEKPRGEKNPS